jgi:hypothetical protein
MQFAREKFIFRFGGVEYCKNSFFAPTINNPEEVLPAYTINAMHIDTPKLLILAVYHVTKFGHNEILQICLYRSLIALMNDRNCLF